MGSAHIFKTSSGLNSFLTLPALDHSGFFHFFGTKAIGQEDVGRLHGGDKVRLRQVHGDQIVMADHQSHVQGEQAGDGLMTDRHGILMTVSTADCLPVVLIDPDRLVAAALHAGWRGTVLNISGKAVERMKRLYGSDPSSIRAGMGPCIGRCCFEVGEDVWKPIEDGYSFGHQVIYGRTGDKARVDLADLNRLQLIEAGLSPDKISRVDLCTFCHPDFFYSYRRDKMKMGNMISGVMLNDRDRG
jgi:hypothetical protein